MAEIEDVNLNPLPDLRTVYALKNNKIEYFNCGFFNLYCISAFATTLTAQRTRIDVL